MKKFAKYLFSLGIAALTFAACNEEQNSPELNVNFTITGDASFDNDFKADIKVTADKAAPEDVDLEIRLDVTSTFTADQLTFPTSLKVNKGDTEVSATVRITDPNKLEPGNYKAVFGAVVLGHGPVTEKVTITYSKVDLTGKWSAIGTVNGSNWDVDYVLEEGADGWYTISGVEAVDKAEFKFRKDGNWDVALGLAEAGIAPLDKEFNVTDAPGSPNIGLESGIYTLSVNPNHKVAKVSRTGDIVYNYSFTGPEAFDNDLKATLKFACDRPVKDDVTLTIAVDADKTTFPENTLTVPASITIEKGATEATAELSITGKLAFGDYTVALNGAIGETAVGTVALAYSMHIPVMTLADLVALKPAENKATADFECILNNAIVTYVSGSNVFLEDETAAMLLYKKDSGLAAGKKISGHFVGKVQNFNELPEISELSFNPEEITIEDAEIPAVQEMTIAEVNANFDKLISKRVKLVNVYAGADIQKKGSYDIIQGEDKIKFYTNVNLNKGFKAGSIFDVVAIVTPYNTDKQVKIFEEASITRLIPKMTMSDIQALCTSSTSASFAGVFDGLYVNYILGTQHIYLEDASGALRYYKESGNTLKVGDKISGVITGTCRLDGGRPVINWLDTKYATVAAAPEEEQPKPVTGTLASFTDVNGLIYRRVTLDNVVLDADLVTDKGSQIITISDATGSFSLHVRFKPSKKYVKGSTLSGTGTFDVASGKLEIRIFAEKEVTISNP